jgi:DNA-binding GntR family transcriptional regulator
MKKNLGEPPSKNFEIKTLRNSIYLYLREKIIKQELKPNQRVQEKDIAKELGLSTTPVREAFLKLESEGYLEINEHRRVIVKPISHSELIEIYQVISVLDGYAAFLALQRMDKSQLKEIQRLTKKLQSFYEKDMLEEYLRANTMFHVIIWRITGNRTLESTLRSAQNQMLRYQAERLTFYSNHEIFQKSMKSHEDILTAFMKSDIDNIERIVREHWNISGILDLQRLRQSEHLPESSQGIHSLTTISHDPFTESLQKLSSPRAQSDYKIP